jgi:hypothetical protein
MAPQKLSRFVCIGDSVTQGFQSGAILRTDWSFPAIIARSLGQDLFTNFVIPKFLAPGFPFNIEKALEFATKTLPNPGPNPTDQWILELTEKLLIYAIEINKQFHGTQLDPNNTCIDCNHNLAVWGFKVSDSYTVNTNVCKQIINQAQQQKSGLLFPFFIPSASRYRTACAVLNPRDQGNRTYFV